MSILALLLAAQAVAGRVQPCSDPVDQSTMTRCAWEEYRRADAELNRAWPRVLARQRGLDRDNPMPGVTGYAAALVAAQRAWIAYRDATCIVAGQEMRGGSGEPMLRGQCLARMTRERIAYLAQVNE